MKRSIIHLVLFLMPFILNTIIVYIVDPYNVIYKSHLVTDEAKYKCILRNATTIPRGQVPWKMAEFERNPQENVIFGDSRMTHLKDDYYTQQTGNEMFNFAIAGGNLQTSIDFFWFCAERSKLKRVFFQVGFINYNDNVNYDIVSSYFKYKENILNYFTGRSVCIDTYSVLYYILSGNENFADIDYHERNIDLWQRGYNLIDMRLTEFQYPKAYLNEFEKIAQYCKENNIELNFIHLPNYKSFAQKVVEYGKSENYSAYFNDLNALGNGLIDPVSLKDFTQKEENYKDVFHFNVEFADSISTEIWKQYFIDNEQLEIQATL